MSDTLLADVELLATVRNLVKAHGGDIRTEARSPEGGAAFTVTLPLCQEAQPSVHRPAATGESNQKI